MLVARRDPPFHVDAHEDTRANSGTYPARKASGLTRFVTAIQMFGSLLAVPVGIASGYSFYRANFSPETTCQGLRSVIVAMLDKNVDAATRRILVRRDVETFEKTCGSVDPDATAAFKTLLAVEMTAAPVAVVPAAPKAQRPETVPKEPVRKVEPRLQAPVKQPVTAATPVTTEPARREPDISDAQWLDAVRQALVTHKESILAPARDSARPQPAPVAVERPASHDPVLAVPPVPSPTPIVKPSAAPALPPAVSIAPSPGAAQAIDDHPVPPESIPDSIPPANADIAKPEEHSRSRIGKWISAIPLLGPVVDNARH
ncbi:MAG TPA: hypothetical protein VLU23_09105 [Pseudolabrys sp.]|jgi:hypothetical protein|nr:hypothetical protein [Pseudolabrys sp.]